MEVNSASDRSSRMKINSALLGFNRELICSAQWELSFSSALSVRKSATRMEWMEQGLWNPMKRLVGSLPSPPPPQYYGCGPINIRHIFFLIFYGFGMCAHSLYYYWQDCPPPSQLRIASYASLMNVVDIHVYILMLPFMLYSYHMVYNSRLLYIFPLIGIGHNGCSVL